MRSENYLENKGGAWTVYGPEEEFPVFIEFHINWNENPERSVENRDEFFKILLTTHTHPADVGRDGMQYSKVKQRVEFVKIFVYRKTEFYKLK